MSLSELFPQYPIQLISPRGANVKIASRRVYVDFPYVFWNFIGEVAQELAKSKSPQINFKRQLELFNSDEEIRKITIFNNIPLGTILLITTPFTTKLLLKLKVNWNVFFQFLENKAQELIFKIEEDGSNIREVYNEIINNYFKLTWIVPSLEGGRFNIYALENFKKLLRRHQEEQSIQLSLLSLSQVIKSIDKAIGLEGIKLWTLQLESDVFGIKKCLENMDILACYFYLRNALENFIKLIVYNDVAKNFNVYDEMLRILFFYEKIAKDRCYSIEQLKSKYVKGITRYLGNTTEVNLEKIYLMMIEKRFPKLSINKQTLEEFKKVYNINVPIENYWSACSEIMHNQSPLPFFSLLEVKAFKHFLEQYVSRLATVIKGILKISEKVTEKEIAYKSFTAKQTISKNARQVLYQLIISREKETEKVIKSLIEDKRLRGESFFDPLTLLSLFHLTSPGLTRIRSGEFGMDDIEYLITKIQPVSFGIKKVSLKDEFSTTLRILEEGMIPQLELISSEFSKLNEEDKKAVTFYLLVIKLPELLNINSF